MGKRPSKSSLHPTEPSSPRCPPQLPACLADCLLGCWIHHPPATKQLSMAKHTQNTQQLQDMGRCLHGYMGAHTNTMHYTHRWRPQLVPIPRIKKRACCHAHAQIGHSCSPHVPTSSTRGEGRRETERDWLIDGGKQRGDAEQDSDRRDREKKWTNHRGDGVTENK